MDSELRKDAVKDFLQRCLNYAHETIAKKTESGDDAEGLAKWIAYRDFTQVALDEIENGELNHWFNSE